MNRPILLTILALCLISGQSLWSTAVQPELKSQLTLEQFGNPSLETDTALRTMSNVPLDPILWGGLALFGLCIYLPEIKRAFTEEKKKETT